MPGYTRCVAGWKSDALIVDAVRSPIGKRNGTLCVDPRRRALRAGPERPRLAPRPRPGGGRGRADGLRDADRRAGLEHRAHGADGRRLAGDGLRHERRPAVRLVDAGRVQRRRRRLVGAARPRRRGRRRDDVARADGLERRRPVAEARSIAGRSSRRGSPRRRSQRSGACPARRSTGTRSSPTAGRARRSTRGGSRTRSFPIDLTNPHTASSSPSTRRRAATRRPRSSPRCSRRSFPMGR